MVDGRARNGCIFHCIKKVKNGGIVILDNSERVEYNFGKNLLNNYKKNVFFGRELGLSDPWETIIWEIN